MKFIKLLAAVAFAASLLVTPALAEDKPKPAACCAKAKKQDKECAKKCCLEAPKEKKDCEQEKCKDKPKS